MLIFVEGKDDLLELDSVLGYVLSKLRVLMAFSFLMTGKGLSQIKQMELVWNSFVIHT